MFMKVDLPEPEGPMMATNSPGADAEIDLLQHRKGAGRRVVVLEQRLDADDRFCHYQNSLRRKGRPRCPGILLPLAAGGTQVGHHHLHAGLELAAVTSVSGCR
jgi:hypothetical protein